MKDSSNVKIQNTPKYLDNLVNDDTAGGYV